MKKLVSVVLLLVLVVSLASCGASQYDSYLETALNEDVTVEVYVQAHQDWWDNKITVYAADKDGAYFLYEMACSEEDSKKLTPGTKIKVSGKKAEYKGEVEIMEATFEFLDAEDTYVAQAIDATALLGTDELINKMNQLCTFKGLTVVSVEYQGGEPGKDIYLTVSNGTAEFDFCVESYFTGPNSDVYKTVGALTAGQTVDIEGYLYWYDGPNPHITGVTVK